MVEVGPSSKEPVLRDFGEPVVLACCCERGDCYGTFRFPFGGVFVELTIAFFAVFAPTTSAPGSVFGKVHAKQEARNT